MKEEMGLLIQLQRIDARLAGFREQEGKISSRLEKDLQEVELLKSRFKEAQAIFDKTQREKKDKEDEIAVQEQTILKTQARLKDLKTNKEYQAHLHEIDALKKGRSALDEAVLLLMDRLEALKSDMDLQQKEIEEKSGKVQEKQKEIDAEISGMQGEKVQIEEERKSISGRVSKKLLEQYAYLLTSRKGAAVAALSGNTCQGCHMSLPPQLVAEVKRNDKLLTCTYCARLLYWQDLYLPKPA